VTATVKMGGPGLLALIALAVLIWAFSAYVAFDAVRRRRTDYAGVPEGRWFYAIPQAFFFVLFIAWQIPWVQTNAAWIGNLLIVIPVVLAQQMAYLLRVVYPTSNRLEKRLDAECALLRDDGEASASKPAAPPAEADGFFDPDSPDE
jgi:hypothetical protein